MNIGAVLSEEPLRAWRVAEIQGLYGPFVFTERMLQKIWLRGEFDGARATIADGRPVRIVHPGRWNQLGGPDFLNARLRLDGVEVTGDVELHLHASDWAAHRHAAERAYDRVALHVVLFPPRPGQQARRADGRLIPTLVLLPLLLHDLEEYAAEDAVETLAGRSDWRATGELAQLPAAETAARLRSCAERRWRQKVHFARQRTARLGWEEACHHTALEILGYRFNRMPMLRTAARVPLPQWTNAPADAEALFNAEAWNLQGVRPANHPRRRLRQYALWAFARPDWPARLSQVGPMLPAAAPEAGTRDIRRQLGLAALRAHLAREITAGAIGGTRFDTLVCDGFLPLLAPQTERNLFPLWCHWFPGDLPPRMAAALKMLGVSGPRAQPLCHGLGQGLLGWMLAREECGASGS